MSTFNPKARFHTFTMIPDDVMRCAGLSYGERCAYSRLIRYFDEENMCACVRNSVFAEALGCSVRSVQRFTKRLQDVGLIQIEANSASWRPNTYYFLPPEGPLKALEAEETPDNGTSNGDDGDDGLGAILDDLDGWTDPSPTPDKSVTHPRQVCRPLIDTIIETQVKREGLSSTIRNRVPEPLAFAPEGLGTQKPLKPEQPQKPRGSLALRAGPTTAPPQKKLRGKSFAKTSTAPPQKKLRGKSFAKTSTAPPQETQEGKPYGERKDLAQAEEEAARSKADIAKAKAEITKRKHKKALMDKTLSELVPEKLKADLTREDQAVKGKTRSQLNALWKKRVQRKLKELGHETGQLRSVIRSLWSTWSEEFHSEGIGLNATGKLVVPEWRGKEVGQLFELLDRYSGKELEIGLKYMVRRWKDISGRFLKGKGEAPTLGLLLSLHDSLMVEALRWSESIVVIEEFERWQEQNPTMFRAPGDLDDRYSEAVRRLAALGCE